LSRFSDDHIEGGWENEKKACEKKRDYLLSGTRKGLGGNFIRRGTVRCKGEVIFYAK